MDIGVYAMVLARGISGLLNFVAVFLMYRYKTPQAALRLNSFLALVGSTVFLFVSAVGVAELIRSSWL